MSTTVAQPIPSSHVTTTQLPSASSKVIKSLDGVRGLAIISVMYSHYDNFIRGPGGDPSTLMRFFAWCAGSGVILFFVLSGFLLFLPYARALTTPQAAWPRTRTFYLRRVRRIFPGYMTVFLILVGIEIVVLVQRGQMDRFPWPQLIPGLLLLYDFHMSSWNFVAGINPVLGVFDAPLWSLTVEWQFYLLLPLIAWGLSKLGSVRRIACALLLLIGYGLAVRASVVWLLYVHGISDTTTVPGSTGVLYSLLYGVHGKYLEIFALGMLASLFYVWGIEQGHWTHKQQRMLSLVLIPVSVLSLVFSQLWGALGLGLGDWPTTLPRDVLGANWLTIGTWIIGLSAVSFILIVLCLPRSVGSMLSFRPLTFVGMISYSLYLWHWPLMELDLITGFPIPPIIVLLLVLVWSTGLYYFVERPFLQHRMQ